jgi:hypothetical protein
MFRLTFWSVIFGAGVYFGANYQWNKISDACVEAGGILSDAGLCEGIR